MAPGLFQLMRKRWKLSMFIVPTATGSILWYYDYTLTHDVMRASCMQAMRLGDEKLKRFDAQPKHITVILNPVAGKRKSKKLYSKWVEPLLHLAGIKVSVIETESPNQAYDIMNVMSNCDGVAIVGGDGTVHEALNGLLHRPDSTKAARQFPIAIMPTGQYNSIARYIHQALPYRNQKEFLIQSTMRLITECQEKYDVLKIVPQDEEDKKRELPVYALRDVRYGKYQDNFVKVSGYLFYQTRIKPYWLRLKRLLKNEFPLPQIESITYTEPCIGCSRCYNKHRLSDAKSDADVEEKSANRRWWSAMVPVTKKGQSAEEKSEIELSKRENQACDRWRSIEEVQNISDFRACMMGDKKVRLSISRNGEYEATEVIETQDVRLKISPDLDREKMEADRLKLEADRLKLEPAEDSASEDVKSSEEKKKDKEEDKTTKFFVDGQPTQAQSIEITSLSKAITIFTGVNPLS